MNDNLVKLIKMKWILNIFIRCRYYLAIALIFSVTFHELVFGTQFFPDRVTPLMASAFVIAVILVVLTKDR